MKQTIKLEEELLDEVLPQDKGIDNDVYADWTIEKVKDLQAEIDRKSLLVEEKKAMLDAWLEKEKKSIQERIDFYKARLQQYFESLDPKLLKKSKTQMSYSLPSGKLVKIFEKPVFIREDETLIKWVEENQPEYIQVKKDIKWADLKKKIITDGNKAVLSDTGEVIEGIKTENKPAEFVVKF
jgi:phage host-nuclease inhibitor protein Gam